jgi:hypothetical protein
MPTYEDGRCLADGIRVYQHVPYEVWRIFSYSFKWAYFTRDTVTEALRQRRGLGN